jgi:tetratricopeptide (TPR) repeat protein
MNLPKLVRSLLTVLQATIIMLLENIARERVNMYEESRSREHLDLAISTWRYAVSSMPDNSTSRCPGLCELGKLLYLRYESYGDIEDLQDAATVWGQFLKLLPENDPHEAAACANIGVVLLTRFQRLGNMDDLEQAVAIHTRAIILTPDGHPDKPRRLSNLGIVLQERFERLGGMEDLKQAAVMLTRAVDRTPDGHPDKPMCLNNLGSVLQERFQQLGGMDDLEQAVVMFTRADDLTPDGHPAKPGQLSNLGGVLHERFQQLGDMDDLEQAVVLKTYAVDFTPDGHPDKPGRLSNLANVLHERFQRLGGMDDLERAVAMKTYAVDLTPDGHTDKPMYLNNLANVLHERFQRLGDMKDLEQAVVMLTNGIDLIPDGHPDKPALLSNLGIKLHERFERLGGVDDLEQAVAIVTRAVNLTPDGHPDKPGRLSNLGIILQERFKRLGGMDDLERVIVIFTHAAYFTPNGHPQRTNLLHDLALALFARYESPYNQPTDLIRAIALSKKAATRNSGNPSRRLSAAILTTDLLLHDPTSASHGALMQAHEHVLSLIPQVVWLGHNIQRRYDELADLGTLANRAAAVAIITGEYSRAVEWLESGRTIVWSQLLHLRTPLDELRERDPKLASKLEQVSYALEHASISSDKAIDVIEVSTLPHRDNNPKHPESSPAQEAKSRYGLAIEYDRLIKQIRNLDGFEHFLRPKPFSDLVPACKSGPVVIINVHKSQCDALVLHSLGEIIHLPLPRFSYDDAIRLHQQLAEVLDYNGLLGRVRGEVRDGEERALRPPKLVSEKNKIMIQILAELWKSVVKPIVTKITGTVSISQLLIFNCLTRLLCTDRSKCRWESSPHHLVSDWSSRLPPSACCRYLRKRWAATMCYGLCRFVIHSNIGGIIETHLLC